MESTGEIVRQLHAIEATEIDPLIEQFFRDGTVELRRITLQEIYSKLVLLDPLLEELTARNEQGDQEARTGLHSAFDARHTLENLEASLNQSGTVEFY